MASYNVHWKTESSTLRVYKEGDSYENRDDSILSASVHHNGDTELFIFNVKGTLCRKLLRYIFKKPYEDGVETVKYDRKGKDIIWNLKRYFGGKND